MSSNDPSTTSKNDNHAVLDDSFQLRNTVIALGCILGTAIAAGILFYLFKAKRWTARGAKSKEGENEELKKKIKAMEEAGWRANGANVYRQAPMYMPTPGWVQP